MSGAETHNQSESDAENDYLDPNDPDDDEEFHKNSSLRWDRRNN